MKQKKKNYSPKKIKRAQYDYGTRRAINIVF